MEDRIAEVVCDLERLMATLVDNYVMVVTERLCAIENENPRVMGQSRFVEQRALILAQLDVLDCLAADLRGSSLRPGDRNSDPAARLGTQVR